MTMLVNDLDEVLASIRRLNDKLPNYPELANRLGQAHAFYVLEQECGEPLFGFSKFVGYLGLTPEKYLADYKSLNGRNTEHALSKWFEELRHGSPAYDALFQKLASWMAGYGKRPREGAKHRIRLMVVKPEFLEAESPANDDNRLLDLLIAVADTLPVSQRHKLRAAL